MFEKMVKRNKVRTFENLIQSQKPLRRVLMLKNALANHPNRVMLANELGQLLDGSGLMMRRKALYLLGKYPGIFKISETLLWDRPFVAFTKEAKELVEEEDKLMKWYEPHLVEKVAKLLMMAIDRRLQLDHLCQLSQELGLPHDFRTRLVNQYPEIFKVVQGEDGQYVQLTRWDDSLAVTTREANAECRPLHDKMGRLLPSGFPLRLPKGHRLPLKQTQEMNKWQKLSFISPYANPEATSPMSPEHVKRAVAVVHEFLSLTLEKMTSVEKLDLLRKQFKLPSRLHYFLHKHYCIFYVTNKGNQHSVFLKEAYRAIDHPKKLARLVDKGPQVLWNERFEKLMEVRVSNRIPGPARRD